MKKFLNRVKHRAIAALSLSINRLWLFVGNYEKVILALLAIVIVVSGSYWFNQFSAGGQSDPVAGGTYVEGIIGGQAEMQTVTTRLTKTGLFRFDKEGQLKPSLVEDWSVNAALTEYRFELLDQIDAAEIVSDLERSGSLFGFPKVRRESNNEVVMKLNEPNPNVPILLTQPLFQYGAYRINKIGERSVIFTRNTRDGAIKTFINKIIVHTFSSEDDLRRALQKGRLDGAQIEGFSPGKNYVTQNIDFPRFISLLFNTNKSPFRSTAVRRALIDNTAVSSEPFTLTAPDKEPYRSIAQDMLERWQSNGAKVNLELKPLEEITGRIGPSRAFQAMLTTIDYGAEYDPHSLWHSTQVRLPGLNVTGVKDTVVDSLVERLRSTYDIAERGRLIEKLHEQLHHLGVAWIIKQERSSFVISRSVRYQSPWVPVSVLDRFQAVTQWSIR